MDEQKYYLHVDMDAFFASVEQRDHPDWKGKPVIVGGLPGERRSVVSTASYEARKYGVHSAMSTYEAYKLCPEGIYTHGDYKKYSHVSNQIMDILKNYSPDVVQLSIDEASIDLTGTELLFGKPDELALKIQKEIFKQTHLTVSCGLASTPYLAKLCSEVNKPNGFFQIQPGNEENFMLQLPLKKVWGIGSKTLERLNKAGFYTTQDIHSKPFDLLKLIFGEHTASFLYYTVRGIQLDTPKQTSHSISAEKTFDYDLTDIYSAETALLELSHTIMFRLLKENSCSKTVMIKIRYDDFSTCTCQETFVDWITSVDDLYSKACKIFENKYEHGRPIRLLGLAAEKVEKTSEVPVQKTLFDFGEKKKQAVENAILQLSSKHPEIKIKKARLLKGLALFFLISAFSVFSEKNAFGQENVTEPFEITSETAKTQTNSETPDFLPPLLKIPEENQEENFLLSYNKNNSHLDFQTSGSWNGSFTGGGQFSFNPDKSTGFSGISPVFKQSVDLSLWFMIEKQWFFKISFADEFKKNTFSAGFRGDESTIVKESFISNRGIIFPDTYSTSLFHRSIGGGSNQAPGFFLSVQDPENKKWDGAFAIRYDMTEEKNATFYGHNKVYKDNKELSSFIKNQFFVLPEKLLSSIDKIYIQSLSGDFSDKNKRKFTVLSQDNYLLDLTNNLLIISQDIASVKIDGKSPSIILTFKNESDIKGQLGDFSQKNTFLGRIQKAFSKLTETDLKSYSYNFYNSIDSKEGLEIYSSQGFSPFVFSGIYDLGITATQDISIAYSNSEEPCPDFSVLPAENLYAFSENLFYNKNHTYVQINTKDSPLHEEEKNILKQFPFCYTNPEIYLQKKVNGDLTLCVQNYTKVSNFYIGRNLDQNSIQVYKNGTQDNNASYNPDNGEITLSSSVTELDKIYITWYEDSSSFDKGLISAQAAFNWNLTKNLSVDVDSAIRWPLNPNLKYAEWQSNTKGFSGIASKIQYKTEHFTLLNGIYGGIENPNPTGVYKIEGFDQETCSTTYNSKYAGHDLENHIVPELNISLSGTNKALTVQSGLPDETISGYKIPVEWKFSESLANQWAAVDFSISDGEKFYSSTSMELALYLENKLIPENHKVYLQLGIKNGSNSAFTDETALPYWEISSQLNGNIKKHLDLTKEKTWQTVQIIISPEQASKLNENYGGRLIIVKTDGTSSDKNDLIYIGPHQIFSNGINGFSKSHQLILSQEKDNSIPQSTKYNTGDNYYEKVSWKKDLLNFDDSNRIIISNNFHKADISDYGVLKFLFKFQDLNAGEQILNAQDKNQDFIFILDTNSKNLSEEGKIAVKAEIKPDVVKDFQGNNSWNSFEIGLKDKKIRINGNLIPETEYSLTVNQDVIPTRFAVSFSTDDLTHQKSTKSGTFSIDHLVLEETSLFFNIQDYAKAVFEYKGDILKIKDFPVFRDGSISAVANLNSNLYPNQEVQSKPVLNSEIQGALTFATIKLDVDAQINTNQDTLLSNANHLIQTTKPILKILELKNQYIFNKTSSSVKNETWAKLNFSQIKIPVTLESSFKNLYEDYSQKQESLFKFNFNKNISEWNIFADSKLNLNQKETGSSEIFDFYLQKGGYFSSYGTSFLNSFSTGFENSASRIITSSNTLKIKTPWLGFVPAFYFNEEQKFTGSTSLFSTTKSVLKTEIPFSFKEQKLLFSYGKETSTKNNRSNSRNYGDDFKEMGNSMFLQSSYFWTAPFYEFFKHDLGSAITNESQISGESYYSSIFDVKWARGLYQNYKDLFIPSMAVIQAARNIQWASDTADLFLLKLKVKNSALNIFGTLSSLQKFDWYETDEFYFSLESNVKIPHSSPEKTLFEITAEGNAVFYISKDNILKTDILGQFQTDSQWKINADFYYQRKTEKSPVLSLIRLIDKKNKTGTLKFMRTNGGEISLNYKDLILSQSYKVNHKLSVQAEKYITVDLGIEGGFTHKTNNASILSIQGTLGGKVQF